MANPHDRKRARAGDVSQERRPYKKIKPNFPPEFWDNLSKVPLTRRALRELDRRNSTRPAPEPAAPAVYTTDLDRFARHGGPDLRRLREFGAMTKSRQTKSAKSTKATNVTSKPKRTSAYDDAFELLAMDNGIYPEGHEHSDGRRTPEPNDVDQLRLELAATRASLSPSQFPNSAFQDFKKKNRATMSEAALMRNVIPIIAGNANIPNDGNLPFTNIGSMTEELTVKCVPDFFDGVPIGSVYLKVRRNLNDLIIPTKHYSAPVAPNFFLETKGPKGGTDVARRQAMHDGAIGARAIHAIQNHGKEEPAYDGKAYTYSATYNSGTASLALYAHHVTPPAVPGGLPEYHMTEVKAFAMGDRDTFVQGATWFRNARDRAKRIRDNFIQAANARARQSDVEAPPEAEIAESPDESVDCEDRPGSQAVGTEDDTAPEDVEEPATNFTSRVNQSQAGSKRSRASHRPPAISQSRKQHDGVKKRALRSASRRAAGSSA